MFRPLVTRQELGLVSNFSKGLLFGNSVPGIQKWVPGTVIPLLVPLAVSLLMSLALMLLTPSTAYALQVDRATARPNDSSGRIVYGGRPTRITWVGNVAADEEVVEITLWFPAGSKATDETFVAVTEMLMENPSRPGHNKDLVYTCDITDEQVSIVFETPIRAGNQLYIEIEKFCLPNEAGNYFIIGSYTDDSGVTHRLPEHNRPISIERISATQQLVDTVSEYQWVKDWNSVTFLKVFFNPAWIVASVPILFKGWLISLLLVLVGFPLAIPIGLGISFMRMSKIAVVRAISSVWVNIIRGTPLFLQIYIVWFGLPHLGIHLGQYTRAILVLAFNSSAYLAEIFRAGIQSINKGQFEAANSLGMNGFQTMFFVIIPQTIRRVIPTMTSEFILLYKDTSLLAAVGVSEQMMAAKSLVNTAGTLTPYVVSAGYYLIVTLPLIRVISILEKRLAASEGRTSPPEDKKRKVEDKTVGVGRLTPTGRAQSQAQGLVSLPLSQPSDLQLDQDDQPDQTGSPDSSSTSDQPPPPDSPQNV